VRIGRIVRLRPECAAEYKRMHAEIWPEVAAAIHEFGIRNYSIYLKGGLLFSYYELADGVTLQQVGERWMQNAACARWEALMEPMQQSVDPDFQGTWQVMDEIFHQD